MGQAEEGSRSLDRNLSRHATRRNRALTWLSASCVVASILGLAGCIGYSAGQGVAIRTLQSAATHRFDAFRTSFFAPIERYAYVPDFLARYPIVADTLRHPDAAGIARLNAFLQEANATAKSATIYVMDRGGVTIASSNWDARDSYVGKNFSFRPYFQEAMRNSTGRFYGIGSVSGAPGYFLSYPVMAGGQPLGVVAVKIDLDNLDRQWEGGVDEIAVTDDSGIIFLSSNGNWKYRSTRPLTAAALRRLQETRQYASMLKAPIQIVPDRAWSGSNVVRIRDPDRPRENRPYLVQSHELPEAKWTISIYSDMREVDTTAMRYAVAATGGAAFFVLLAMYILQVRHRAIEKEGARKAAQAAREQLEEKHRELEALSEHLKTMSISDPLTGCYNRRYFQEIAPKMVSAAQRHRRSISILMLDVDFFKKINDSHGHLAGDAVLKGIAQACRAALREPDFLVRFGGEEFVAVLPDTATSEALLVAERLREAIERLQVPFGELALRATVSIGLSEFVAAEDSLEKAFARADTALYEAKRSGRNRVVGYAPELEGSAYAAPVTS
jgi:two-component system, NtrC family, C4-dicarboxylate transport sensor histidine kinase DctB